MIFASSTAAPTPSSVMGGTGPAVAAGSTPDSPLDSPYPSARAPDPASGTALPTLLRIGAEAAPAQAATTTTMEAISAIRAIDGRMVRIFWDLRGARDPMD